METENRSVVKVEEETQRAIDLGLLRGNNPAAVVASATSMARELKQVVDSQKLSVRIQGRTHVLCEGWTTLAVLCGLMPREVVTLENDDGSFLSTVELVRIADGRSLSSASALCGIDEPTWNRRAKYARRSMAQTRATSKVCRMGLSWIMSLAGYETTPAEEMPKDDEPRMATKSDAASLAQKALIMNLKEQLGVAKDKFKKGLKNYGITSWETMTNEQAKMLVERLQDGIVANPKRHKLQTADEWTKVEKDAEPKKAKRTRKPRKAPESSVETTPETKVTDVEPEAERPGEAKLGVPYATADPGVRPMEAEVSELMAKYRELGGDPTVFIQADLKDLPDDELVRARGQLETRIKLRNENVEKWST